MVGVGWRGVGSVVLVQPSNAPRSAQMSGGREAEKQKPRLQTGCREGARGLRGNLYALSAGPEWMQVAFRRRRKQSHVSGATLPCLQCHVSGPREQGFVGLRWCWGFRALFSSLLESGGPGSA